MDRSGARSEHIWIQSLSKAQKSSPSPNAKRHRSMKMTKRRICDDRGSRPEEKTNPARNIQSPPSTTIKSNGRSQIEHLNTLPTKNRKLTIPTFTTLVPNTLRPKISNALYFSLRFFACLID
ncbi:hypothetical protein DVH24_024133 [Malus domestica]|uniref:Uncharacterized protein n=1 Tax=Malus domestica TaxID=3750 RepID=A0A498JF28_MALDO|nr:hypothetical protein DVH24_024133 [Malus domestica]